MVACPSVCPFEPINPSSPEFLSGSQLRPPQLLSAHELKDLVGENLATMIEAKLREPPRAGLSSSEITHLYPLAQVQDFLSKNMLAVVRAWPHRQLSKSEHQGFLRRAYKLLSETDGPSFQPAYQQLAKEYRLSPEVVRLNIRRAFFSSMESLFSAELLKQESALKPNEQIAAWRTRNAFWMHYDVFDSPNADFLILKSPEPPAPEQIPRRSGPCSDLGGLVIPVAGSLSAEQEHYLFTRYNYLKCRVWHLVQALKGERENYEQKVQSIREQIREVIELRDRLVYSNLALVLAACRRNFRTRRHMTDIVEEGSLALVRAVERFDISLGIKFSCSVYKAAINAGLKYLIAASRQRHCRLSISDAVIGVASAREHKSHHANHHNQSLETSLRELVQSKLTPQEQQVIRGIYYTDGKNRTLQQVGNSMGITGEWVRQLRDRATQKLRSCLDKGL